MSPLSKLRKRILEEPGYWVEGINSILYQAIVSYMEEHNLNRNQLAEHLDISKGRVSQILNEGDINFSIEKLVEIGLKIGRFPNFGFQKKQDYFAYEASQRAFFEHRLENRGFYWYGDKQNEMSGKVRQLRHSTKADLKMAY